MTQLKPSNIFDFYAPTGGAPKIADFTSNVSNSAGAIPAGRPIINSVPPLTGSNATTTNIPSNSTENNTWIWVIGGIAVATVAYFIYDHYQKKKKNEKKNVLHVFRPSDQ